ncbi:DUF6443 domain-containing protein [Chryseobacterium carnipullorum]|uniref:DUF6443 domain-containing protein n=1 Tax=Chryseobacterium carnipullorum TaxID=1124835 RepID=UPI000E807AE4|nr:DUF6443 domain-containing protein [Chryseobacterium carnipullorum]HBV17988.1 sugar-binding protein [Chryseobacterium carnipullorum]
MKKKLFIFGLLSVGWSEAQTTTTENYISETNCLNEDCSRKTETVQYFDFLGRAKQVVNIKATPAGKDVVTPMVYDELGRQTRSYLPIPQNSTSNGAIYPQTPGMTPYPVADVSNTYAGEKIYTEQVIENSPLQRVLQQKNIGNDWNTKSVVLGYDLNTTADHVKKYDVTTSWNPAEKWYAGELQPVTEFQPGQLMKSTVTDEDGNKSIEFKNASGQTVLARKVLTASQNADTYYVYNDYRQLTYVIPPLASVVDQVALDNLCYQYRYDSKNRLTEKKIPGKGWEYFVYDKQDRMVLSQDALLATTTNNFGAKGWLFSKYDEFGRVVYTGFFANTATRSAMQTAINNMAANPGNNEKRTDTAPIVQNGENIYYTKNAFPTGSMTILTVHYYDTYPPYSFNPAFPTDIFGPTLSGTPSVTNKSTKGLPVMSLVRNIEDDHWTKDYNYYDTKGRSIGSYSINHLGGYTKTELELDFAGATKQSKVYHKRLATDPEKIITQTFVYDHQNRLLVQKHKIDQNPEEILAQHEYNELSQLTNKKVGGTAAAQPLQSIDYTYNIRGWLTKINDPAHLNGKLFGYAMKYSHPVNPHVAPGKFNGTITEVDWKNASEGVLKRYNYVYDGMSRLQDAVYSEPDATIPFNNNFNEHLTYDLNGNIKTLKRRAFPVFGTTSTLADDLIYDYTGNRLTRVVENALNDTGYEGGNHLIDHDLNGNMTTMKDKGIQGIHYNFLNLSNNFSIVQTMMGSTVNSGISYLYAADGTKLRKTYTSIREGRGAVMTTQMTDYLDGFQYSYLDPGGFQPCLTCKTEKAYEETAYKNVNEFPGIGGTPEWKLDFVPTAEGFYSFTENRYIYQYKDHLGNARVSFAKNSEGVLEITDTNNYYPFGLNHIGGFSFSNFGSYYSYKYNDKELQETGFLDYGWRQYMPDLGRWNGIDQLADAYHSTSPFAYVAGNPVMMVDPDGRWMDGYGNIDNSGMANPFMLMGGTSHMSPSTNSAQNLIGTAFGLGGTWHNTGSGFENGPSGGENISLGYDGSLQSVNTAADGYINIPEIKLKGSSYFWGAQIRSHVNSYMSYWNRKSDFANIYSSRNKIGDQVLPAKQSIIGKIWSAMSPREWEDSDGLSYQVNSDGRITNIAPLMGDVPLGLSNTVRGYNITSTAVRSALGDRIGKRGFLEVGYQFQKHFGRSGNWAIPQGVRQNPAMFNQAGYDTFKEIWRSPGSFQRVGGFIEKRLSDGRGIRFQENWKFKGFLD